MRLLTYQQAAEQLDYKSSRTMRRIVDEYDLMVVYLRDRSPRIPSTELDKLMQGLIEKCQSTNEKTAVFGGHLTQTQAAKELDALLSLATKERRKK